VLGAVQLPFKPAQTGFGLATGIAPPQQLVWLRVDEGAARRDLRSGYPNRPGATDAHCRDTHDCAAARRRWHADQMRFWDEMPSWLRRTGIIVVGWALVLGGIAALVLPGPGLLLLLAGLIVLSQEYEWAERRLQPVRIKAFTTAAASVQTWPRVAITAFGGAVLVGLGVVWAVNPPIPEFWIFGPELPFGGLGTGLTLALSGVIVWALLVYSVRSFRGRSMDEIRRSAGKKPNPATRQQAR